jgi:nucleotide-binding universal stress UspA family protein
MATNGRIVVGIDGSDPARAALDWAAKEAELRGAKLEVVGAWAFPMYVDPMGGAFPMPGMYEKTEANEREMVEAEVAKVLGAEPKLPVEIVIRCGSTATELLAAAEGADMLVIGSRGRGGFASLLLGSTALQCIHHATCPVTVVRMPPNPPVKS